MRFIRSTLVALPLVSLTCLVGMGHANAFTVTPRPDLTDTEFNQLITDGIFAEYFVAESRIGNSATNGTHEFDILNPANNLLPFPGAQGQRQWVSSTPVPFTLEYTGSAINYTVGGQLLSVTPFNTPVTNLYIRTRATSISGASSSITLSNLVLNSTSIANTSSATFGAPGNSDIDYVHISGLTGAFTLLGESTFSWTGTRPNNSNLAYQIKAGGTPSESTPEPGMVGALVVAGVGLASRVKRKVLYK